jgi:hypothetical protein
LGYFFPVIGGTSHLINIPNIHDTIKNDAKPLFDARAVAAFSQAAHFP